MANSFGRLDTLKVCAMNIMLWHFAHSQQAHAGAQCRMWISGVGDIGPYSRTTSSSCRQLSQLNISPVGPAHREREHALWTRINISGYDSTASGITDLPATSLCNFSLKLGFSCLQTAKQVLAGYSKPTWSIRQVMLTFLARPDKLPNGKTTFYNELSRFPFFLSGISAMLYWSWWFVCHLLKLFLNAMHTSSCV